VTGGRGILARERHTRRNEWRASRPGWGPGPRVPSPTMPDLDVLVAGAGPAGLAAALTAHHAGLAGGAVERATFPRHETCGDGLPAGALRGPGSRGVAVPRRAPARPVDTVALGGPGGARVSLPLLGAGRRAVVTTRVDLDAALVARARAAGVAIDEG